MSDRLLKESDVMRIAFQLPYVVNSAFFDAVKALPSADRPINGVLFKGRLEEGDYNLIKTTDGWVLKGKTSYVGFNFADRPQEWIPCSERLPKPYTEVLVCDECGWVSLGSYRPCDVTEKDSGWSTLTSIKLPTVEVLAWMPLPKPWKGADNA